MYKEDKLAEICEQLEEERDYYHDEMNAYKSDAQSAQKRADEFSSYWISVDKLSEKIELLPAKDFIKLYYRMQDLLHDDIKSIPIRQNADYVHSFTTAYN